MSRTEPMAGEFSEVVDSTLQSLDPRHITAERIAGSILMGILLVGAGIGLSGWALGLLLSRGSLGLWGIWGGVALGVSLALTAFGWLLYRWPAIEHRHTRWRLLAVGLEIRRGVWWRHRIAIPRDRVQHTDVTQGPLMRRFGLATLVVHTAGTEVPSIELPGLSMEVAQWLKEELTGMKEAEHVPST